MLEETRLPVSVSEYPPPCWPVLQKKKITDNYRRSAKRKIVNYEFDYPYRLCIYLNKSLSPYCHVYTNTKPKRCQNYCFVLAALKIALAPHIIAAVSCFSHASSPFIFLHTWNAFTSSGQFFDATATIVLITDCVFSVAHCSYIERSKSHLERLLWFSRRHC